MCCNRDLASCAGGYRVLILGIPWRTDIDSIAAHIRISQSKSFACHLSVDFFKLWGKWSGKIRRFLKRKDFPLTRVPSGNGSVRWYILLTCSRRIIPSSSSHSVISAVSHVKTSLFFWKLIWMSCLSTSGSSKLTTKDRPSVDSRKFELCEKKKGKEKDNYSNLCVVAQNKRETYIDFCLFTDFGVEKGGGEDSMRGTCIGR